jgi:hypothetical protein
MGHLDDSRSIIDQLKDEYLDSILKQAEERQLNLQTHPIAFDVAMQRLRENRNALQAASVEGGLFDSLPASIQKECAKLLGAILKNLINLKDGDGALCSFASSVDALHAFVWRNRIADESKQLVCLNEAMDRVAGAAAETQNLKEVVVTILAQAADLQLLTQQARDAAGAANEAQMQTQAAWDQIKEIPQQAQAVATAADEAKQIAEAAKNEAATFLQQSRNAATATVQAQEGAEAARQQTTQFSQQAQQELTNATERNRLIEEVRGRASASEKDITSIQQGLKALYTEGEEFRKRITDTEQQASTVIAEIKDSSKLTMNEYTTRIEALLKELEANEGRINHALDKATGVSLFDSFDKRRDTIGNGKWLWAKAAMLLGIITAAFIAYALFSCREITSILYIKLGLLFPMGALVWMCIAQYNHERRLEEEYAFKSNISLSLVPYKNLVATAFDSEDQASKGKYAQFLVDSVEHVFTPPFDQGAKHDTEILRLLTQDQLKLLAELANIVLRGRK